MSSHTYKSALSGGPSLTPDTLEINMQDNDFADSSVVAGGTTESTTINIGGIAMYETKPYIRYSTQWTGGNNTWNSSNYTNRYAGTVNVPNRTWFIENDTQEQVNIRLKVSEYTGASTGSYLSAEISYQPTGGSTLTQNANTGGTSLNGGGNAVDYSQTAFTIPAGGSINIEWDLISIPSGSGWVASLQYWSGTGASPGLTNELTLLDKIY